jgi:hypothetical protein
MRTRLEVCQALQLLIGDPGISAHGRVDIHSKGTTYHLGRAHRDHRLETASNDGRSTDRLPQLCRSEQNLWPVSHHEIWGNHAPEQVEAVLKYWLYLSLTLSHQGREHEGSAAIPPSPLVGEG